jgi:serine/threonine-protein kinase
VLARPDNAAYRLRKFVGRHRAGVAIAAAIVLLLSGFALRERTLRARAESEARKSKAVQDYLVSVFDVADPFAPPALGGSDATARDLVDRGEKRIDTALAGQPDVQDALRSVLGKVYTNLGLYDKAAPLLQRSLDQRRAVYGPRNAQVAEAMDQLGVVLTNQDQLDRAEQLLREALALRRTLLGNADTTTAESINNLATLLQEKNDYAAAEPLFQEALAIHKKSHGPGHRTVGTSLNNLALLYYEGRIR